MDADGVRRNDLVPDETPSAYGEVVWSRCRDAGIKLATMLPHHAGDGGNQARSPRRSRRKPFKPSRGESRIASGGPVVTNSCAFFAAHEAAGATDTRLSLRPLFSGGTRFEHHSGATRAAGMRSMCLRGHPSRRALHLHRSRRPRCRSAGSGARAPQDEGDTSGKSQILMVRRRLRRLEP
jgi:hypothetical protein